MTVGERVAVPALDAWMRERGLLVERVQTCSRCYGRGGFWRHEGHPSERMYWNWCDCTDGKPGR